jgi:hypothetical protein
MLDEDSVLLRASLRAEMRKRGIADSVGAVGEQLAIEHFRKTPGLPKLQLARAVQRTWMFFPGMATASPSRPFAKVQRQVPSTRSPTTAKNNSSSMSSL